MSKKNGLEDLFYSESEILNFALHKYEIDVYEIIEPENDTTFLYAIIKEIDKTNLEKLDQCGFSFCSVDGWNLNGRDCIWVQFRNKFD